METLKVKHTAERLVDEFGRSQAIRLSKKCINYSPIDETGFWEQVVKYLNTTAK